MLDRQGEVVFESLVQPTQPIHPKAREVHRLTDHALRDAPALPAIAAHLNAVLEHRPVVTFNTEFDERLMRQSYARYGLTEVRPVKAPNLAECSISI